MFNYLEVILKDERATKRNPDPETKQRDMMGMFRNRCSMPHYADAIVKQFSRLIYAIVSNHHNVREDTDRVIEAFEITRWQKSLQFAKKVCNSYGYDALPNVIFFDYLVSHWSKN
jgi:hypothetical protein